MTKKQKNEKYLQRYLIANNELFIERYIKEILGFTEYGIKGNIEFLGSELNTGIGKCRCDLVYRFDYITPMIIVVELKQEVQTDAIVQVENYIKQLQKSQIYENKKSFHPYRYIGIVAGKWVRSIVKELINMDLSGQLSYIDFKNNSFKQIGTDGKSYYYENQNYEFELNMY